MKKQMGARVGLAALLVAVMVISSGCQGFALLDQPPRAVFTVKPEVVRVGEKVTLDASDSSDPQGHTLTFRWKLSNARQSSATLSSATDEVVTFYPDEIGDYFVSLAVTGRAQSDYTDTRTITADARDPAKSLFVVKSDANGTVEPSGTRALDPTETLSLSATPKAGFQFDRWSVVSGSPVIADPTNKTTTVTMNLGSAEIQALFVATATAQKFLGWGKTSGTGLLSFDIQSGLVTDVGPGGGDGSMVDLCFFSGRTLYGVGNAFSPSGSHLFVIDSSTGSLSEGVSFQYPAGTPAGVKSAAFSSNTLFALSSSAGTLQLFTADPASGVLTLAGSPGVELDSLAVSPQGQLYGSDGISLYTLTSKGQVTKVGSFGLSSEKLKSLTFGTGGILYARNDSSPTTIYAIDRTTGTATESVLLNQGLLSLVAVP